MRIIRSEHKLLITHKENINPARGDITIIISEKQNELTEINVARCSGGTI